MAAMVDPIPPVSPSEGTPWTPPASPALTAFFNQLNANSVLVGYSYMAKRVPPTCWAAFIAAYPPPAGWPG